MRNDRALTLVELLASLAVAAILVGLAIPPYFHLIRDNTANATANKLLVDLHMARSEAVTRGTGVMLCKGTPRVGCSRDGGWDQGWLAFTTPDNEISCTDLDEDQICDGHDGKLLRVAPPVNANLTITGNGPIAYRVRFQPTGFASGYAGTLSVCDVTEKVRDRGFVLSLSGRIRKARQSDLNCPGG